MKKAIGVFLGATALALAPTAANAHPFDIHQGADYVHISDSHSKGWVRDMECDGNKFKAVVDYGSWVINIPDENGCDSGGTEFGIGNQAEKIKACEQILWDRWDCSAWYVV